MLRSILWQDIICVTFLLEIIILTKLFVFFDLKRFTILA